VRIYAKCLNPFCTDVNVEVPVDMILVGGGKFYQIPPHVCVNCGCMAVLLEEDVPMVEYNSTEESSTESSEDDVLGEDCGTNK
jgi:hypothetical protein